MLRLASSCVGNCDVSARLPDVVISVVLACSSDTDNLSGMARYRAVGKSLMTARLPGLDNSSLMARSQQLDNS